MSYTFCICKTRSICNAYRQIIVVVVVVDTISMYFTIIAHSVCDYIAVCMRCKQKFESLPKRYIDTLYTHTLTALVNKHCLYDISGLQI